jgi:high-affinity iron transporter
MNFIFTPRGAVVAAALTLAACGHPLTGAGHAADGGDGQRLAALLDYVGGDYGRAVRAGSIVSAAEYDEQLRFLADARRIARDLVGPGSSEGDPLLVGMAEIESLVRSRGDAERVGRACAVARDGVVSRFRLPSAPSARPSLARAQALYAENCAVCHGTQGDAATERARELDPPPASFREAARLETLSPYRVYNALTFGVSGTAMASFESLSPSERWDLAFFVFRLGHEGREERGPVALTLADMASRSDRELLDVLRSRPYPDPRGALVYARREAAFAEPAAEGSVELTRRLVHEAAAALSDGRAPEADRLAIDAYLQGFEPLEPRLQARDPLAVTRVEIAFGDFRAALTQRDVRETRSRANALDALLLTVGDGNRRGTVPFWAAAVIYFREGIEAALVVAALLAALRKLGRADASRFVHLGWLAALPAGVVTWWLLDRAVSFGAGRRELIEAGVALLASAVLFSVSFWMVSKAESRHWMAYLRRNVERSVGGRNLLLLSGLAFLAAYREAAEVVLFTQALLLDAHDAHAQVWLGAATGAAAVAGVALLASRTVLKLPLGPFFAVSSALLCALAIGFAGSGMHALVAAGYLTPRPVPFPEVPWMGIHPDLSSLAVQLTIVAIIATAGVATLRRLAADSASKRR